MKTLILYESKMGYTEKCARILNRKIQGSDIFDIESNDYNLNDYDKILIGAPIYIGELFSKSIIFFILPLLTTVFAVLTLYFGYKENGKKIFIYSLLTMTFFLITGFVGIFPYMIPSNLAIENGITIYDAAVSNQAVEVVLIVVLIFYPLIFLYQGWKYKNFTTKVKLNDE